MLSALNNSTLFVGKSNLQTSNYAADMSGQIYVSGNCTLAASGGYVGIGKTNPQYPLDISGTMRISIQKSATYFNKYGKPSTATQMGSSQTILYIDSSNINQLDISGSLCLVNKNITPFIVTPNSTEYAIGNVWVNNGITWTATYSTILSGITASNWNNTNFYPWASAGSTYAAGNYTAAASTKTTPNVNQNNVNIITINGEYIQIQSSIPVVLNNYSLNTYAYSSVVSSFSYLDRMPGAYSIVGSNDGAAWFVIQDASFTSAPTSTAASSSNLFTQSYSVSIIAPANTGYVTPTITTSQNNNNTTTYTAALIAYTYFRLIINKTMFALALSGVNNENGTLVMCGWNPNFTYASGLLSTISSSAPLVLDNLVPNQLNVGSSLGIANGITPIYLSPCAMVGQIGYTYTSLIANSQSIPANISTNISQITNVPAGIWLVSYACAFTTFVGLPLRLKTFVGTTSGGVNVSGINVLQVTNADYSSTTNSIVCNTASTYTFYLNALTLPAQSCYTYYELNSSYFQATRIA